MKCPVLAAALDSTCRSFTLRANWDIPAFSLWWTHIVNLVPGQMSLTWSPAEKPRGGSQTQQRAARPQPAALVHVIDLIGGGEWNRITDLRVLVTQLILKKLNGLARQKLAKYGRIHNPHETRCASSLPSFCHRRAESRRRCSQIPGRRSAATFGVKGTTKENGARA